MAINICHHPHTVFNLPIVVAPVKPKLSTSSLKTIKEHDALQFNVAVSGSPFPDVTWYKEQKALVTCRGGQSFKCQSKHNNYKIDDRINILNRGSRTVLTFKIINPLHPANNGEHRIKVQNLAGEDQATLNVSIIGKSGYTHLSMPTIENTASKNAGKPLYIFIGTPAHFSHHPLKLSMHGMV